VADSNRERIRESRANRHEESVRKPVDEDGRGFFGADVEDGGAG